MRQSDAALARSWVRITLLLPALGLLLPSPPSHAQTFRVDKLSIEPRIGVVFPTGDFGNVDPACPPGGSGCDFPKQVGVEAGWRWDLRLHYALTPRWGVVGGFGKTSLDCTAIFCGFEDKPGAMSLNLGLRGIVFPLGSMDFWVEGGGVLEKVSIIRTRDVSDNPVSKLVRYPWSLGFQGGIGAELALTGEGNFYFSPGFRFSYVPADPPDSNSDLDSITATYVLAEIGFRVVLGGG